MVGYSVLDLHVHVHVQCKMVGTLPNITILFCVAVDRGGNGCVDGGSTGVDIASPQDPAHPTSMEDIW